MKLPNLVESTSALVGKVLAPFDCSCSRAKKERESIKPTSDSASNTHTLKYHERGGRYSELDVTVRMPEDEQQLWMPAGWDQKWEQQWMDAHPPRVPLTPTSTAVSLGHLVQ
mmetsp:Transcript_30955/g.84700  ORF Transcript_30955/g.84700 Transcript_30955/m.84700 type:complete len:112 (+) Transcript_30955:55-390(+)|eukprot:7367468-Prymnesium_polylepis.1